MRRPHDDDVHDDVGRRKLAAPRRHGERDVAVGIARTLRFHRERHVGGRVDLHGRSAHASGHAREHRERTGFRRGRNREFARERTGGVDVHDRTRERGATTRERHARVARRSAQSPGDALAREADEANPFPRPRNGGIQAHADDRGRNRRLRQDRDERATGPVFRKRERRSTGIAPDDHSVRVRLLSDQAQADQERDGHVRKRATAAQIDAPHDEALGTFLRQETDVGSVEPDLLHGVAAPRFDDVEALLSAERHRHVVRFEPVARGRREPPRHERFSVRGVERASASVLARDDHFGRVHVICGEVDRRAGIRVQSNGRRLPRHVRVAREEREVRIPLMFVEERPCRASGGACERQRDDQENGERTRHARLRTWRRNRGRLVCSAGREIRSCNRDCRPL